MPILAHHAVFVASLILISLLFALIEIQIEGEAGWAESLPTWRVRNRWTERLLGARAITGYHLYFHLFVFAFAHLPYVLVPMVPSLAVELRILAFLVLFWVVEDFLWFVLNPAWGLRKFRRSAIPWHAETWWWFMPRDYWAFTPLGVGLYVLSWLV